MTTEPIVQGSRRISWEKWTAISTILMALCALGTSFWQGYTLKQHNKLSVRPMLQFEANFQRNSDNKIFYEVLVNNNGLGPAEVIEAKFILNGHIYDTAHQLWPALGFELDPNCLGAGNVKRFYKVADQQMVIRTLDKSCLLSDEQYQKLDQQLQIRLVYRSLYEEEFTVSWGF